MVEQVRDLGIDTDVIQVPEVTAQLLIAEGTHLEDIPLCADLIGRRVLVDGEDTIKEDQQTYNRCWQQPPGVQT